MPYKTNADLPSAIRSNLPESAQNIWRGAFNGFSASNPDAKEESAFRVAWSAVKKKFKKVKDNWVALSDFDPDQPRDPQGRWASSYQARETRALQQKHQEAGEYHATMAKAKFIRETNSSDADLHQKISDLHLLAADTYRQAAEAMEKGDLQAGELKREEANIHAENAEDKSFKGKRTIEPLGYWTKVINPFNPIRPHERRVKMDALKLFDTVVFDGIKMTKDGYLTGYANVARTGIQVYKGKELGRPDLGDVRVYRPPNEVFNKDALKSLAHRPITFPHPPEMVNSRNWNKYAKGHTGDEVIRDGDHVRVPMVVMDAATIRAVMDGKAKELSLGYSTDLKWKSGKTPKGELYDAIQTSIRGNHLAIVPVARGGETLRLGDQEDDTDDMCPKCGMELEGDPDECPYCLEDLTDSATSSLPAGWVKSDSKDAASVIHKGVRPMTAIVMIDGASIEVADELSASVIRKHIATLTSLLADAKAKADKAEADKEEEEEENQREQTDAKKKLDAKDGEIIALKKQLADANAANTPEVLDKLVKARAAVIDAARSLLDKSFVFDGKKVEDIRRAAVTAKIGDSATKDMNDASVEGAFLALTVSDSRRGTDRLADSIALHNQRSNGERGGSVDIRDEALAAQEKWLNNAWRTPSQAK